MFLPNVTKSFAAVLARLVIPFMIGVPVHAQTPPTNVETTNVAVPTVTSAKLDSTKESRATTLYYNKDTFYVPFTAGSGTYVFKMVSTDAAGNTAETDWYQIRM